MYGVLQNSIRHNLSLHDKFKRIQNEGTGKSSWWTINYNAKPGKSPRRRVQSMDQSMASKASKGAKMAAKRKVGCLTKLETSSSYLLTSVLHLISITFYTIHQVFTPQHRGVLSWYFVWILGDDLFLFGRCAVLKDPYKPVLHFLLIAWSSIVLSWKPKKNECLLVDIITTWNFSLIRPLETLW